MSNTLDPILKRSAFIRSDCCSFKDTDDTPPALNGLVRNQIGRQVQHKREEDVLIFENESANHSDASDAPCLLWAMRSAVTDQQTVALSNVRAANAISP